MVDNRSGDTPVDDPETPFESIESAHEYVTLLVKQVEHVSATLTKDFEAARQEGAGRRVEALRLVSYKLKQLKHHLHTSGLILNDLRVLRRLLLGEREAAGRTSARKQAKR